MKHIIIAGRLTKDAESRQAGSSNVTAFSVAVDHGFGDKKTTLFFECSWFGKRGEAVRQYLTKGGQVTVAGEFSTREYNGKTYLELNVADLTLQGGGQKSGGGNQQQSSARADYDDHVPF